MFHTEALRLEELLAGHGMAVRVGQASLSTDTIRFPLQLGLGATTRRLLGLSHQVAHAAGYSHCRLRREGRLLFLELPRDEGAGMRYGDLLAMTEQPPTEGTLLGMMEGGALATFNLMNPAMRHLLVTGAPGVGKSDLLRVLALGMASHHAPRFWRLALLESQPTGPLAPLRALSHCWAWSECPELTLGWLVRLVTELGEREREGVVWPHVLAVVDDVEQVLAVGGSVVRAMLKALLSRGGAVGLHLVVACRSEAVLGDLLPLFQVRLRGEAPQLPGRFALHHEEQCAPLWAARLDEREVRAVVERMGQQRIRLVAHPTARSAP